MRILRLELDDVIIAPFAVIAVAVACQGETLLSLFVFVLWREQYTRLILTGRIYRAVSGIGNSRF